jgi:hypothetical protein
MDRAEAEAIHDAGRDLLFDLRRRRYGTSHGVGLLQLVFSGLEGTYAVASTAPGLFTARHRESVVSAIRDAPYLGAAGVLVHTIGS